MAVLAAQLNDANNNAMDRVNNGRAFTANQVNTVALRLMVQFGPQRSESGGRQFRTPVRAHTHTHTQTHTQTHTHRHTHTETHTPSRC